MDVVDENGQEYSVWANSIYAKELVRGEYPFATRVVKGGKGNIAYIPDNELELSAMTEEMFTQWLESNPDKQKGSFKRLAGQTIEDEGMTEEIPF
jgi:hypothetical protein